VSPIARLSGVGVTHADGTRALDAIDLNIDRRNGGAERIAIIGPSGAGKTTLLRVLATALKPDRGQLQLLDTNPWRRHCLRVNAW